MINSQGGSFEGNANVCQSCGTIAVNYEEAALNQKKGIYYVVLGWMFFAISLLFMPILFGGGALVMGFLTYHERSQIHGLILMFFASVGLVIGSLFSFIVAGTMFI